MFSLWEEHLSGISTNCCEMCPSSGPVCPGSLSAVVTMELFLEEGVVEATSSLEEEWETAATAAFRSSLAGNMSGTRSV